MMDSTTLENSIKQEAEERILSIRNTEEQEIGRLDEMHQSWAENFRTQIRAETDAQIRQELVKMENKMALEHQKRSLWSVENFTRQIMEEVLSEIRNHPLYPPFLISSIVRAGKSISGQMEIRLTKEDLGWEKNIQEAVRTAGINSPLTIRDDPSIRWGGCLVMDEKRGRIFNLTLERIYFRKSSLIRRRIVKILANVETGKPALAPREETWKS